MFKCFQKGELGMLKSERPHMCLSVEDQPAKTKEDMYLRFRNAIENVNVIIVTWLGVGVILQAHNGHLNPIPKLSISI